jgi:hypothetical protein
VETPPIGPGETLGIDLYIASSQKLGRNSRVTFRLYSVAAEAEGAQPAVEEFNLSLGSEKG